MGSDALSLGRFGFGVSAGYGRAILEALAAEIDRLGYESVWANDSARHDADGLADLAIVHAAAPGLTLGVGVVPLDRRPPQQIAADLRRLELPLGRLRLGVGSGNERARPLDLVRRGVADLRSLVPDARIFVGALGPRMCELAGEVADGVLLNWAVPERLSQAAEHVAAGAAASGRDPRAVETWTYVRAAVGVNARERLGQEAARYAAGPAYGRQFAEMAVPLDQVGVVDEAPGATASPLRDQLRPYRAAVDGVVVRALPATPAIDELREIWRAVVA